MGILLLTIVEIKIITELIEIHPNIPQKAKNRICLKISTLKSMPNPFNNDDAIAALHAKDKKSKIIPTQNIITLAKKIFIREKPLNKLFPNDLLEKSSHQNTAVKTRPICICKKDMQYLNERLYTLSFPYQLEIIAVLITLKQLNLSLVKL